MTELKSHIKACSVVTTMLKITRMQKKKGIKIYSIIAHNIQRDVK